MTTCCSPRVADRLAVSSGSRRALRILFFESGGPPVLIGKGCPLRDRGRYVRFYIFSLAAAGCGCAGPFSRSLVVSVVVPLLWFRPGMILWPRPCIKGGAGKMAVPFIYTPIDMQHIHYAPRMLSVIRSGCRNEQGRVLYTRGIFSEKVSSRNIFFPGSSPRSAKWPSRCSG